MSTPHINAKPGDFGKVVLMPGDPLRAKWIAENFLTDVVLVNEVRGILAFTGKTKNGARISVMASGMGMPSIGIYAHELFTAYGVEAIIRVGTAGAYQPEIQLKDIIIAAGACTDSNWMAPYSLNGATYSAIADYELLSTAVEAAKAGGYRSHVGNILSSDIFYDHNPNSWKKWAELGCLCVDMETYGLYQIAAELHKKALGILSTSNSFLFTKDLTPEERQTSLTSMIKVAIEAAEKFA